MCCLQKGNRLKSKYPNRKEFFSVSENENKSETIQTENQKPSNGGNSTTALIVKTAVRAALSTLVCIALLCALFVTLFPYDAMKIYVDFGNRARALECAENYIARNRGKYESEQPALDSRYVSALYMACELSISLYNGERDADNKKLRAADVKKYTEEYLAVGGIQERNHEMNKYNIAHSPYYQHTSLYSYRDYLARYNYLARCELNERNAMLVNGVAEDIGLTASRFLNQNIQISEGSIDTYAEIFNALSAMIAYDFKMAGASDLLASKTINEEKLGALGNTLPAGYAWFAPLIDRQTAGNKTLLMTQIEDKFVRFRDFVLNDMLPSEYTTDDLLHRLYAFRALTNFADSVFRAQIVIGSCPLYDGMDMNDVAGWRGELRHFDVDGTDWDMTSYHLKLEKDYMLALANK